MAQSRKFYRLTYPASRGPTLEVSGRKYQIVDLSEEGVRLRMPPGLLLKVKDRVGGTITFPDGQTCKVSGEVLRIQGTDCILRLSVGVPLAIVISEQLRLIRDNKDD